MVTVTLRQPVSLRIDAELAKRLGISPTLQLRKGANQVPAELANHWAITANKVR